VTVTYAYDGLGERVTKSVAGGLTTTYVHDVFGNLAEEYTTGGTASAPPCTTCYLSWDHLGSTRMMTDQNGNVVARHDYLPFGVEIPAGFAGRTTAWDTTDNVSAKFTGKERDAETGLDFFQARYHGSAQGRFLSPDPAGNFVASTADPQSWNMYAYARNNPLSLVDPTGLDYCSDEGYDINSGDVSEEDCYQIGGTWNPDAVFVTNVDQYNGDQSTYYGDDSSVYLGDDTSGDSTGWPFGGGFMSFGQNTPGVTSRQGSTQTSTSNSCPAVPAHPASANNSSQR
jgi:RHS repeat-associated protein